MISDNDLIEERIRAADAGNFATGEEMEALYAEIAPSLRRARAR